MRRGRGEDGERWEEYKEEEEMKKNGFLLMFLSPRLPLPPFIYFLNSRIQV